MENLTTYTTFLMNQDAIMNVAGMPDVTHWQWDYNLQQYIALPRGENP